MRPGCAGGASQPDEDRAEVEATIEQVLHLGKVSVSVLVEVEGVIGAGQRGLQADCGSSR